MALPIVLQLQELASGSHDIADLLRKALVVATKLDLSEFKDWINNELNGYSDAGSLPAYRIIRGDLRAQNPYHGLIPFIIDEPGLQESLTKVRVSDSVASIKGLLDSQKKGAICYYFTPEQEAALMRMQGSVPLRPLRVVGSNQLDAVLNTVRTKVLEWALSLEKEGILGEGFHFTEAEKQKADSSKSINIQNFQGILGDVSGGNITQTNTLTVTTGDFESLKSYLLQQGCPTTEIAPLQEAISKDPKPSAANRFGPMVSGWMGKMIALAASGGWDVGVSAAGTLLAAAISKYYGLG